MFMHKNADNIMIWKEEQYEKIYYDQPRIGAGGGEIGRKVAERLGYHYYDKELILRSADTSKVDVESMRRWDEKVPANFGFARACLTFTTSRLTRPCLKHRQR